MSCSSLEVVVINHPCIVMECIFQLIQFLSFQLTDYSGFMWLISEDDLVVLRFVFFVFGIDRSLGLSSPYPEKHVSVTSSDIRNIPFAARSC
mmetsp:Transcript_21137/g.50239  ORF Transcript_21137/g.50239 Transcript_21137/m.50239 type:complete len:92 (-) Transcript_21137:2989-3264(-)